MIETEAPVVAEYVPSAHAVQVADAGIGEYVPAAQSAQLEELDEPVLPFNLPVEHGRQLGCPEKGWY